MAKVALIRCESYDYTIVKKAIEKGLNLIGGATLFASPKEKILLKPNMLSADDASKASITHNIVAKAVADIFKDTGAQPSYGDSPGFHSPAVAGLKTGISAAMEALNIPLADFDKGREIHFEAGLQNKRFTIANGVLDSDALISISKFKTHGLTRFTGAVKNQFGCIPGKLKGEFHVRLPDPLDFSKMLVDLNRFLSPRLYIMDGIIATEGNGPRSGTPRKMNVLLFSTDPVALDATACRMIDLDPQYVPTNLFGMEQGLGTYLEKEIEILGDSLDSFKVNDFDAVRKPVTVNSKIKFVANILKKFFVPKPFILYDKCIKCGICIDACPVSSKAVNWVSKDNKQVPPVYDYSKCIRCFCCQELCPQGAIEIKLPLLRKIFDK